MVKNLKYMIRYNDMAFFFNINQCISIFLSVFYCAYMLHDMLHNRTTLRYKHLGLFLVVSKENQILKMFSSMLFA